MSLEEELSLGQEISSLRAANWRLQKQLRAAKTKVDDLVEATFLGAKDAMVALGPIKSVPTPPKDSRKKSCESALWHMTDWQLGKQTATYNSDVAQERVMRFCFKAAKITDMHRLDHPVKHCTIAFGGDMLEGVSFNFPTQPFEIDSTLFTQYVTVSRLMVDVIRYALSIYESVQVVSEWGNHGRLGSKRDAVPKSDNADRLAYELARQQLIGESRLTWDANHGVEDIQRIEIGNYRCLLIHGDEVGRGGFSSPMTLVRHGDRWGSGAYPWEFNDIMCGHYHNHAQWSLANGGAFYQTGSTESSNLYARDTMSATAVPSQRLHFVDPERGRVTAVYQIYVAD